MHAFSAEARSGNKDIVWYCELSTINVPISRTPSRPLYCPNKRIHAFLLRSSGQITTAMPDTALEPCMWAYQAFRGSHRPS